MITPVYARLPCSVVHAVEDVQEHRSNVTGIFEVHLDICLRRNLGSIVCLLPYISSTPDSHGNGEENYPVDLRLEWSANCFSVQRVSEDACANDLGTPVEDVVERSGANVELW